MTDLPNKPMLRPDEVAAFWSVSVKTIYRWIDLGILPGVKKGGTVRVPREEAEKGKPVMETTPIIPAYILIGPKGRETGED